MDAEEEVWVQAKLVCDFEDMMYSSTDGRPPHALFNNVGPMQCSCGAINTFAYKNNPRSRSREWIPFHLNMTLSEIGERRLRQKIEDCLRETGFK